MPPRPGALILDYGEVLVERQPEEYVRRMAERVGAPVERFRAAYWAPRAAYALDGRADRYWGLVLSACGRGPGDGALVRDLVALDVASWTIDRPEVWALASEARARGIRTAILSNCGPEVFDQLRAERRLEEWFDAVIVSWEVGLVKPDRAIYELCLGRLGVRAEEPLFVDDRVENLEGAAGVGIGTFHFTGGEAVGALEERLGI
jgi:putative hydrolase of the HAD superfamily